MPPIPDDIRRFILNSVPSVPYLEALLLFHKHPEYQFGPNELSLKLYINTKSAADILKQLHDANIIRIINSNPISYQYHPATEELKETINHLSDLYSKNLIEVTNLIHSNINKKAQKFADAFLWKKDK